MSSIKLNDGYSCFGKEITEFSNTLCAMDDITFHTPVKLDEIEVLTVMGKTMGEDGVERVAVMRNIPGSKQPLPGTIPIDGMRKGGVTEELLEEMFTTTKLLLRINKRIYFTSAELLKTLPQRINLGGTQILIPTPKRDEYIAELFSIHHKQSTMMYRQVGSVKKVFSLFSKNYAKVDQAVLSEVISNFSSELGRPKCEGWHVEHSLSGILLSFPEKAADIESTYKLTCPITPCLYLGTSDTGCSSFTAIGKLMVGHRSYVYSDIFRRKHRGEINPGDLLKEIETRIFAKYTKIPERLCELMAVPVSSPQAVAQHVLNQIQFTKAVGKETSIELTKALLSEFTPGLKYTAYDIALMIMSLPGRCHGVAKSTIEKLEEACGRAPFAEYGVKKAEPVLLTA